MGLWQTDYLDNLQISEDTTCVFLQLQKTNLLPLPHITEKKDIGEQTGTREWILYIILSLAEFTKYYHKNKK